MAFLLTLIASLIALIVQMTFPPPDSLGIEHWAPSVLMVIYGTLFLPAPAAWFLAFAAGLFTDLLSESRLGSTTACFLLMTFLLQTQELRRWRWRWYAQVFFVLVGTMFFQVLEWASFCIQQERLVLHGALYLMAYASLCNAALTVPVYALMNYAFRLIGCEPERPKLYES